MYEPSRLEKYTRGKWSLSRLPDGSVDVVAGEELICSIEPSFAEYSENWSDNARLISAAPDLLEALQDMLSAYDVPRRCCNKAREAIDKALGDEY